MSDSEIFGLPQLPVTEFNRLAKELDGATAPQWNDTNGDQQLEPGEIQSSSRSHYVAADGQWTKRFEKLYRNTAEKYRRELVHRELELTFREEVNINFDEWIHGVPKDVGVTATEIPLYQAGIKLLIKLLPLVDEIYGKQIGFTPQMRREHLTTEDRELLARYKQPWGVTNTGPFAVALPSLAQRSSGVIEHGIVCDELGKDMMGLANPFSAVIRQPARGQKDTGGTLVPYATYFRKEHAAVIKRLAQAAKIFTLIPREQPLAAYLEATAESLLSTKPFPYEASDEAWRQHGKSNSILFVRLAADEVGGGTDALGDTCGKKARYHMIIGLRDFSAAALVDKFKSGLQAREDRAAALVGDPNLLRSQPVAMNLPNFWTVIGEAGDGIGTANGTTIGSTLPNWCGPDGLQEPCPRLINIFTNKTLRAYNADLARRYIFPLLNPRHYGEFNVNVGLDSVVLHEIEHNVGPQPGRTKPGTDNTYAAAIDPWGPMFEELKAQNGSLDHPCELLQKDRGLAQAGKITSEQLAEKELWFHQIALNNIVWGLRQVIRATRHDQFKGGAYAKAAAIELGELSRAGAFVYDEQNRYWTVDYDRFCEGAERVTGNVDRLYAQGDPAGVEATVKDYTQGAGFALLHHRRLQETAANLPSALFIYRVTGLD